MPKKPILRRMLPKDLPRVHAIEKEVSVNPWTSHIFASCLERYDAWVFESEEGVVGFGFLMLGPGEAHILNLAIDAKVQRRGLGYKMLTHMINHAKQHVIQQVYLEVRVSNESAIRLYERCGFKRMGIRKDYYETLTGREDARLFMLPLMLPPSS